MSQRWCAVTENVSKAREVGWRDSEQPGELQCFSGGIVNQLVNYGG